MHLHLIFWIAYKKCISVTVWSLFEKKGLFVYNVQIIYTYKQ